MLWATIRPSAPWLVAIEFILPLGSWLAASQLLYLFQLRRNHKFVLPWVVLNMQEVRLAAHLAIFHVRLGASGRLVHRRLVPLAAAGTLESGLHYSSIFNFPLPAANWKSEAPYNGDS